MNYELQTCQETKSAWRVVGRFDLVGYGLFGINFAPSYHYEKEQGTKASCKCAITLLIARICNTLKMLGGVSQWEWRCPIQIVYNLRLTNTLSRR